MSLPNLPESTPAFEQPVACCKRKLKPTLKCGTGCSDLDYEIIIVDDNSPDGTQDVVRKLQKAFGADHIVSALLGATPCYLGYHSHDVPMSHGRTTRVLSCISWDACVY